MKRPTAFSLNRFDAPCMGCAERTITCHVSCLRYAEYKELCEEEYKKRRLAKLLKEE